ncbi:MAG: endonuclease/exonuclease/phosphatase family protein [Planctomycetes bacterium]|nr:endonuclease/exonuclease/phosphatase family protein [Planctomycetota bacterium]
MISSRWLVWIALGLPLLGACKGGPGPHAHADRPLRVVSYNIRHGVGMDDHLDLERTARVLRELDADVVLLQEVDEICGRSGSIDQAAWLANELGMQARFAPFMAFDGGRYGLATLSRLPIENAEVFALPPGRLEPRSALVLTVEWQGRDLRVANAHLDWLADDAERWRQAQTLALRLGEATPQSPVLLGGDLNDTPESRTLTALQTNPNPSAALRRLGPNSFTFPAPTPERTIDHFLFGPLGFARVSGLRVVDEIQASDHRPIVVELVLRYAK